jgi:hypothetical protein
MIPRAKAAKISLDGLYRCLIAGVSRSAGRYFRLPMHLMTKADNSTTRLRSRAFSSTSDKSSSLFGRRMSSIFSLLRSGFPSRMCRVLRGGSTAQFPGPGWSYPHRSELSRAAILRLKWTNCGSRKHRGSASCGRLTGMWCPTSILVAKTRIGQSGS